MAQEQGLDDRIALTAEKIRAGKTSLGIEFGSTRIKAVLIDDTYTTIAAGDYGWASHLEDGLWSYSQEEIWTGLQTAYAALAEDVENAYGEKLTRVGRIGFSAMMHGYLAFGKDGELLVPFRTWQNTNTSEAHEKLSELFQYNIPERWSIAHLYQAVLNNEEHIGKVDFFTTLAGYVHWKLTGKKVLGVGDASGMFPIDPTTHTYETEFIEKFNAIPEVAAQPWKLADLLPEPLVAGTPAGTLTEEGAKLLDPTGTLQPGITFAPPEGDAGTGMVATNSVRVRTGNVSAGTSIFAMVVLERKLERLHPEVDLVTTPAGDLAGMSHANNFTSDLNAWVGLFGQFAAAIGTPVDAGTLYGTLFRAAIADDVDSNCGGLINYPFRSGEFLAGLPEGRPLFARGPEARMSLGNFMRAQLFSAFSPVKIGMDVMTKDEGVAVDSLVGHGGIFTTPKVAQKILAAAFDTPIKVMSTAAEGGAWGMAVLADYLWHADQPLDEFLDARVFADAASTTENPDESDVAGFEEFFDRFRKGLPIEHVAIESIPLETK
ncbi:xylulokinase [Bifidobacterium pseudocatenulatum]|jgi:sugar (pentulose or hexulose) kinase|uniref:xylulokinase n=1 Tax=Bifidobacterium pseudocatenulatum TaxID=28026 RepID=UPI000E42FC73|nr:FGGY-family carbohydrate kinase [Bifidobacterium pseudocatenulatum]MDB6517194.1 FGGY-family carbohydrate kinase [Bifidobacterium pseudocatenulatum]MDB6519079.1 FGGY-family carbohydrate kinase [Bifidobacterium pseudocatenulatum]MDB6520806.1 FGGY-family carbohydrate kinase [Bifidobacterium pseudocatenulatum]MDB6522423.1 FGGY-family carbohydrate kinase [Bifidobacterium pseudocatenulatum]MDB6524193.1 FGGY-family carbohydrate kinase [Bifidobacterium pseudocatenulatum]